MFSERDLATVRELASRVAEIAALPVQEEKKAMWRKLNALEPVRPMVMLDQLEEQGLLCKPQLPSKQWQRTRGSAMLPA